MIYWSGNLRASPQRSFVLPTNFPCVLLEDMPAHLGICLLPPYLRGGVLSFILNKFFSLLKSHNDTHSGINNNLIMQHNGVRDGRGEGGILQNVLQLHRRVH